MKLRSTLAVAMTLALGASLFTATSASAYPTSGDFTYRFRNDNTVEIVGWGGTEKDLVIPSTIANRPVTRINDLVFANKGLTSVVIPDSINALAYSVFANNNLTSVTIGAGLGFIPDSAFENNKLVSVTIPNNVTDIGFAFTGNPTLEWVKFLGNAPRVYDNPGTFDTTNPNFTVIYEPGATGFGSGAAWHGYPIIRSDQSRTNVTAGVTAGVRSAGLTTAAFDAVTFSHAEQSVNTNVTLSVDDLTGANAGWNVTTVASDLTWSAVTGGPSTGSNLPASALAVTTVGSVTTVSGDTWAGNTSIGALDSPVKVLSTSGGSGAYSAPLTLTLTIPGQASVGTYAGTLTTTISAAP